MANKRFNVNFSEDAYNTLLKLSARKGKPMADVLRDALALEEWVDEAQEQGGTVLIDRNGRQRELMRR